MIRIARLAEPDILQKNASEWSRELCQARQEYYRDLGQYEQGQRLEKPQYPDAKKSRYAHLQVQKRLSEMFGSKCAYCESRIKAVTHSHVEHFRPQSIYPRLAYSWHNLLQACPRCNSDHKKKQFPLLDGSEPREDAADPGVMEGNDPNALLDPCSDDPEEHFLFVEEKIACKTVRGEKTREVCGLDRPDLEDDRRLWLIAVVELAAKHYQLAIERKISAEEEEFGRFLNERLAPSYPYVAMTRCRLAALGIEPSSLQQYSRPTNIASP